MADQPTRKSKLIPVLAVVGTGAAGLLAGFVGGFWMNSLDDQAPLSYGIGAGLASSVCGLVAAGEMTAEAASKAPNDWWATARKTDLDRHQFNLGFNQTAADNGCPAAAK